MDRVKISMNAERSAWLSHLCGGIYEGYDNTGDICARLQADSVWTPVTWDAPLSLEKYYRGLALVRIVDTEGKPGPFAVRMSGGTGIQAVDKVIETDALGCAISPAFNWQLPATATVSAADGAVSASVQANTRSIAILTLRANMPQAPGGGIACAFSGESGRVYALFPANGRLMMRVFDGGAAGFIERAIADVSADGGVAVCECGGRGGGVAAFYSANGNLHRIFLKTKERVGARQWILEQEAAPRRRSTQATARRSRHTFPAAR